MYTPKMNKDSYKLAFMLMIQITLADFSNLLLPEGDVPSSNHTLKKKV